MVFILTLMKKANEISKFINWNVQVSNILNEIANEHALSKGFDIADYLLESLKSEK